MSHSKTKFNKPSTTTQPHKKTTTSAGSPVPASQVKSQSSIPSPTQQTYAVQARTSTVEAKPAKAEITANAIAEAAYFLWLKRGGNETVNWLEAEASLRTKA